MDKNWIYIKQRLYPKYLKGMADFIEFAYTNQNSESKIYCPCQRCGNIYYEAKDIVSAHLVENEFSSKYMTWTLHWETSTNGYETRDSN